MNPPSREVTREALQRMTVHSDAVADESRAYVYLEADAEDIILAAARAWERIAPDENGEWPTQIGWFNPNSKRFCYIDEMEAWPEHRARFTVPVIAVEAELVRLAGETDD